MWPHYFAPIAHVPAGVLWSGAIFPPLIHISIRALLVEVKYDTADCCENPTESSQIFPIWFHSGFKSGSCKAIARITFLPASFMAFFNKSSAIFKSPNWQA